MEEIREWLVWMRETIRATWRALVPLRVTILVVATVGLAFGFSGQGQDALRIAGETESTLVMVMFFVSVPLLAIVVWYTSRLLLSIRTASRFVHDWAPRLLGALTLLAVGLDAFKASRQYGRSFSGRLDVYGWTFCLGAVVFLVATWKRREVFKPKLQKKPGDLRELMGQNPRLFALFGAFLVAFFAAATLRPQNIGLLGAPTIMALAGIAWVLIGALVVHAGELVRIPIITSLIVLAFTFSKCNDNHVVLPQGPDVTRKSLAKHFDEWSTALQTRYAGKAYPQGQPVFLVATEGGGIRAGYWTAAVLTALHDQNPEFSDHLFAVSSVSGGSLGAVAYAALLETKETPIRPGARRALRGDPVGPLLAAMLQPDLTQNFLPWPLLPDRAAALEGAWERDWDVRSIAGGTFWNRFKRWIGQEKIPMTSPRFSDGFLETFVTKRDVLRPSLFLNATLVERGRRVIVSNVQIESAFDTAYDALGEIGGDIKLSTAAHLGARFPYVSPAATIRSTRFGTAHAKPAGARTGDTTCENCNRNCCHIVDGGYFENSGAMTTQEILGEILPLLQQKGMRPVILVITATKDELPPYKPQERVGELSTPISALFAVRGGHTELAMAQLKRAARRYGESVEFTLKERSTVLPLGWALAEQSRNVIDASVGLVKGPNWNELTRVQQLLGGVPREDPEARWAWDHLPPKKARCKPDIPIAEVCR